MEGTATLRSHVNVDACYKSMVLFLIINCIYIGRVSFYHISWCSEFMFTESILGIQSVHPCQSASCILL